MNITIECMRTMCVNLATSYNDEETIKAAKTLNTIEDLNDLYIKLYFKYKAE